MTEKINKTHRMLIATKDGQTVWTHLVSKVDDPASLWGVVSFKQQFVYCHNHQLFFTQSTGGVAKRLVLSNQCQGVRLKGDLIQVKLGNKKSVSKNTWLSIHDNMPPLLSIQPDHFIGRMKLRNLVDSPKWDGGDRDAFLAKIQSNADKKTAVEAALKTYKEAAAFDKTNPWFVFWQGIYADSLGDKTAAQASFNALINWKGNHRYPFVTMANYVDKIDPILGDKLFTIGMKQLLSMGYEPEQTRFVILAAIALPLLNKSVSATALEDKKTYERLKRRAHRVKALNPIAEGAVFFWKAMQAGASFHKEDKLATEYNELKKVSRANKVIGSDIASVKSIGFWLNLSGAWLICLFILALIKCIRVRNTTVEEDAPNWVKFNPYARWRKSEIVSLLLALPVSLIALFKVAGAISVIGFLAAMPMSLGNGNYGSGSSQQMLSIAKPPLAKSLKALGLIQVYAALPEVEAAYKSVTMTAMDHNNLGVAQFRAGKTKEAQASWNKAFEMNAQLESAQFNLNKSIAQPTLRTDRLIRYGLKDQKILAYPEPQQLAKLWESMSNNTELSTLSSSAMTTSVLMEGGPLAIGMALPAHIVLIFFFLIPAVLGLIGRREVVERNNDDKIDLALAALVPGASKYYGFLSFGVGLSFGALVVGFFMIQKTNGSTNILDAIATPSFSRLYGVGSNQLEATSMYDVLCLYWFVVLLLNIGFVGAMYIMNKKSQST